MIVADNLVKQFERTTGNKKSKKETFNAVDHISFSVKKGEILGVLGPNGAGKTTLLRMLGSLMKPTEGCVYIEDENHNKITDPVEYKKSIGYLSGNTKLYHRMSTREMLHMLSEIYGLDIETATKRIEEIETVLDIG